jgi:hypothetical protein
MELIKNNLPSIEGYIKDLNNVIKCKNGNELKNVLNHASTYFVGGEYFGLDEVKTSLKNKGLKTNFDMIINYICYNNLSYNIKYVIMEDINVFDNLHKQDEINKFRDNVDRNSKSLYISMCLENILIICDIIETIWDKNNIQEIVDFDNFVSKGRKAVSWIERNETVLRFYNNGSEKTWRFRFIQQLGIQLEKQISLIKGII